MVSPGDKIKIEKIEKEEGKEITFNDILLLDPSTNSGQEKGKSIKIGTPFVKGAKVTAKVLKQDKAKKVIILKYKPKKRSQTKKGHRQPFTEVEILKISLSSQKSAA